MKLLLFNINSFKIMNNEKIKNELLKIISEHVVKQCAREHKFSEKGFSVNDITLDSLFCDDLGMDSLDRIELAMEIEKAFSLPRLEDAKIEKWVRVSDSYRTVCDALKVA